MALTDTFVKQLKPRGMATGEKYGMRPANPC